MCAYGTSRWKSDAYKNDTHKEQTFGRHSLVVRSITWQLLILCFHVIFFFNFGHSWQQSRNLFWNALHLCTTLVMHSWLIVMITIMLIFCVMTFGVYRVAKPSLPDTFIRFFNKPHECKNTSLRAMLEHLQGSSPTALVSYSS